MQVLINTKYPGLNLTGEALARYNELAGTSYVMFSYIDDISNYIQYIYDCETPYIDYWPVVLLNTDDCEEFQSYDDFARNDPCLIQVYEEFRESISDESQYQSLKVITVPNNCTWELRQDDWEGETLVISFIEIDRDNAVKLYNEQYGIASDDAINMLNILSANPDLISINEEYNS